jgi:hypothetical protein
MFPRTSIGGETIRARFSNAHGTGKLQIGAAHVVLRSKRTGIVPGTGRALTFNGSASATISTGALLSDLVDFPVAPLTGLAVSVWLPAEIPASFGVTGRYARQTNTISPPGDFTGDETIPDGRITDDAPASSEPGRRRVLMQSMA